jgi:glycosyltransferase involved in cell wall biosynthesis
MQATLEAHRPSQQPTIAVVTLTLNCAAVLPQLIDSLHAQSDQEFDWVVADGASQDNTLQVIANGFPQHRTQLSTGRDFGIYDALNKAIANLRADYYLVLGADDVLYPNAIADYRKVAQQTGGDIIAAAVDRGNRTLRPMSGRLWLRGGNAFVASHAVATLIRRDLHHTCGYYSNRYVNCADMHFILTAVKKCDARVVPANFVAGRFSDAGVSSADAICSISDAFRIQLAFGGNKGVQYVLYVGRLLRALFFAGRQRQKTASR